jgi:hypothetical protein
MSRVKVDLVAGDVWSRWRRAKRNGTGLSVRLNQSKTGMVAAAWPDSAPVDANTTSQHRPVARWANT